MWRGKGEPGQSITFTFTFPKKTFTFSHSVSNITKIYKERLRPSPKPKSQDHLVVSVGWLSLCRGLCAVKAKTGFKPTICCLGYSLKYILFDIFTVFLFCVAILQLYIFTFFDWNINDSNILLFRALASSPQGPRRRACFPSTNRDGKSHTFVLGKIK